ncbi:energy-coupling factor transporter transmembrane component T [Cutibacterium sp.]|uniref:energy-coupling factor transporter transmembrane component T n=1 Tax=Cutibacterium sp. TaxID=1912221 RepID=UPI0026DD2871|nr:energy-coupling factor transporter transmembrane component T [Cutibacterium sp.]MDO4413133.1 energy-coupling factor transporter transmembrane component T [Cutibacterium sp.]
MRTVDPIVEAPGAVTAGSTRTVHPWSWWGWAAGCGIAISLTNNPLLVVLIMAAVALVVALRRTDEPWARSTGVYAGIALTVIVIRVFFQILMGGDGTGTVVFRLPEVSLPDWAAGIRLGGPVSAEGLAATGYDALRLAGMLICFGAANSLANPRRVLKSVPAALHDISVSIVIALSIFPQLIASVQRVRRARRLRGDDRKGIRALVAVIVPVLEDSVETSMSLARGMESRGYGRTRDDRRVRPGTRILLVLSVMVLTLGCYGILANPTGSFTADPTGSFNTDPSACAAGSLCSWFLADRMGQHIGILLVIAGIVGSIIGLRVSGRRLGVSRYRPDPWTWQATASCLCGAAAMVAMIWLSQANPDAITVSTSPVVWPPLEPAMLIVVVAAALPGIFTPAPQRSTSADPEQAASWKNRKDQVSEP